MCYFKRIVYACNHALFLGPEPALKCHMHLAYEGWETELPCGKMWPHSYRSVRVGRRCGRCAARREREDGVVGRIREELRRAKMVLRIDAVALAEGQGRRGKGKRGGEEERMSPVRLEFGNKEEAEAEAEAL